MKPNTRDNTTFDGNIRGNNELREAILQASDLFWEHYFPDAATKAHAPPALDWRLDTKQSGVWVTMSESDGLGERSCPHFYPWEELLDRRGRTDGTLQLLSEVLSFRSRQRQPILAELIQSMEENNALR